MSNKKVEFFVPEPYYHGIEFDLFYLSFILVAFVFNLKNELKVIDILLGLTDNEIIASSYLLF